MQKIVFNQKIYKLEAVKQAVAEFNDLAEFEINKKDQQIEVVINNEDKEVKDVIKDELANYVLGLMS